MTTPVKGVETTTLPVRQFSDVLAGPPAVTIDELLVEMKPEDTVGSDDPDRSVRG